MSVVINNPNAVSPSNPSGVQVVANGTGLDAQTGFAAESTYGTFVTPDHFPEFTSEGVKRGKTTVQGGGLRAGGQVERASRRVVTTRDAKGPISFDLVNTGMGLFFKAATGVSTITQGTNSVLNNASAVGAMAVSVTGPVVPGQRVTVDVGSLAETRLIGSVTGAGPYLATVAPGQLAFANAHASGVAVVVGGGPGVYTQFHTLGGLRGNSLSYQKGVPSSASIVEPYSYPGGKVTDIDVSVAKGGLGMLALGLDFQDELTLGGQGSPVGPALAVPSYSNTATVFSFLSSSLSIGGVKIAGVEKANTKLTNTYKVDRFFIGSGGLKAEPLVNAWRKIEGSLDAEFTSRAALYDAYAADASLSYVLSFVGPLIGTTGVPATLDITIPIIKLGGETPAVGGPDVVKITAPYVGLDDGVNPTISYALACGDATY